MHRRSLFGSLFWSLMASLGIGPKWPPGDKIRMAQLKIGWYTVKVSGLTTAYAGDTLRISCDPGLPFVSASRPDHPA